MAFHERITHIELEDEDGNLTRFRVVRFLATDSTDETIVRSKTPTIRPGGMVVAVDVDMRTVTTPDDAQAVAHRRGQQEVERLRARGLTQARGGGEGSILPDQERVPARRARRGSERLKEEEAAAEAASTS
jgi:hypothetical protein